MVCQLHRDSRHAVDTGAIARTTQPRRKQKPVVVGLSKVNNHVKSVETQCTVDIFVSRLHPQTSTNELVDCVNTVKGNFNVCEIKCNKLQSKYEHLYASFHVAVTVSSSAPPISSLLLISSLLQKHGLLAFL